MTGGDPNESRQKLLQLLRLMFVVEEREVGSVSGNEEGCGLALAQLEDQQSWVYERAEGELG